METPLKEQESSLRSSSEPSSCTSEAVAATPGLANQEEEILWQLYRPLEECCNKCFCKKCCYHCQLCFVTKGLGITYERSRRRVKKKAKTYPISASNNRSLSTRARNSQPKKEQKKEVETEVESTPGLGK
ncbi:tat protein [Simian immunodeficiency virus]|uniref:Protein Tat n=1 Tax=Simian immunodeficiency virus TaxID=11723 RepID=Q88147_SIV|nr:tat protein [Simian immunodeficiency virus]